MTNEQKKWGDELGVSQILELQNASGSKEKKAILSKYKGDKWFERFLYYLLNPTMSYNVSEKTLRREAEEQTPIEGLDFKDIFDCCEYLSSLKGIDDATLRHVRWFLSTFNTDEQDIYIGLLSKTLRLGVTAKTVNEVIGYLIPEWEVQQAYSIERYPLKEGTEFWATQKLNGVRATFYNGNLVSRNGLIYTGLDHIIREIGWLSSNGYGFVLDGELTLKDKDGLSDNEAFRVATGIINSDEQDKSNICYTIFDAIPISDFDFSPSMNYSDRRKILDRLSFVLEDAQYAKVLPVLYRGTDQSVIWRLLDKMVEEDKEGLMINTDVPYKRTRHRGILKVKRFYTMDLPIIDFIEGNGRLKGTLGSVVVDYNGNSVNVGSGFSDIQREQIWKDKDKYVGCLCEVKYKEISKDKTTGKDSLQFPVFVSIRTDKQDCSFD